jgi:hypothetical protein
MSTLSIPRSAALNRWDMLPIPLREVLFSPAYAEMVSTIAAAHHLTEEKTRPILKLVGYVVMGFLHPTELGKAIQEELELNRETAEALANELDLKIFSRFRNELTSVFHPFVRGETETEAPEAAPSGAAETALKFHPPALKEEERPAAKKGEGPLILHEEKPAETQRGFKGFSMPLSFLRSKAAAPEAPKASAKVEMPPIVTPAKRDEPRTVHYSENRTPLSPFGSKDEFINLETFEKFSPRPAIPIKPSGGGMPETPSPEPVTEMPVPVAPSTSTFPQTPPPPPPRVPPAPSSAIVPPPPPAPAMITPPADAPEGGEPKLKGNIVDLR